jgi:hypothetical protein
MPTKAEARRWARLEEILLPGEWSRANDFLDLMLDLLPRISTSKDPTPLDWVAARAIAADIWRFDRETSDGDAIKKIVLGEPSYHEGANNGLRDQERRNKRRRMCLEGVDATFSMLEMTRAGAKGEEFVPKVMQGGKRG